MKKLLLSAIFASAALGAMAQGATYSGSMLYGYCTNAQSTNTFDAGTIAGQAIQFDESSIKYFMGCRITAIAVANGSPAVASQTSWPINLFVTDELANASASTFAGEMDLTKPFAYKEFALAEPIEIRPDTRPFYVGFSTTCDPTKAYPIVTDGHNTQTAGPGDWYGMQVDDQWVWEQLRAQAGMCALRVKIEGNHLPANDVSIMEGLIPTYGAPGSSAEVALYVRNDAGNAVESLTFSYTINGSEAKTATVQLPAPLIYNDYTLTAFPIERPDIEGADIPVEVKVTGINADKAPNQASASAATLTGSYLSLDPAKGYEKAMVAEIATGTWCGYCPQGFVAVEKMHEAYPDNERFIPIAVHIGDQMTAQSYSQLATEYTGEGSAPSCVVNRDVPSWGVQVPSFAFFNDAFKETIKTPALVKPAIEEVTFDASKKRLTVKASAEFAIPVEGEYAFSYVLTEDNVGPYDQTNYYSPAYGTGLTLEWWDEQPQQVSTLFGAVARQIYSFRGIKGSIPASVQTGGKYEYSGTLQTNLVKDINNCHVILMVVNRTTGRIENAVSVPYGKTSAIESVETEITDAPALYFDLQGRAVANPEPGHIYIERRGSISRTVRL